MKRFGLLVIVQLVFFSLILSCSKIDDGGSNPLTTDMVVGSYYYHGSRADGRISLELDVSFEKNGTGVAIEKRWGTFGFLGASEFAFSWKIVKDKVYLSGTSASASSDGSVGVNESRSAIFEYIWGMLVPVKGYDESYMANSFFSKVESNLDDYVKCNATLERASAMTCVTFDFSGLKAADCPAWLVFRYGLGGDEWFSPKDDTSIHYNILTLNVKMYLYMKEIESIDQKEKDGKQLTEKEQKMRKDALKGIDDCIAAFKAGKVDIHAYLNARHIGASTEERSFNVRITDYKVVD